MATNNDSLYNARASVPNALDIFARWEKESAQARADHPAYLDVAYGSHPMEKMDIFRSQGPSRALIMLVHGGYWRALDKKDFSFAAPAFVKAGVTVAIPNYALCPAVTVEEIVRQMLQASAWIYRNASNFGAHPERIYIAGHSAGGHLTAMMMAALWPQFSPDLPKKIFQAGFSVSGLYDLRPLTRANFVNVDLKLTEKAAAKVSPALMPPATDAPLCTAVGSAEPRGFHDQNAILNKAWGKVIAGDYAAPGDNHFSIMDKFATAGTTLNRAALRMMGLV
ncbi:MAG: alpha/beta hydrolase [Proteobacteria bacterium]|nr:alpha/beta hydrolase [Pseudomonadota bacterium]